MVAVAFSPGLRQDMPRCAVSKKALDTASLPACSEAAGGKCSGWWPGLRRRGHVGKQAELPWRALASGLFGYLLLEQVGSGSWSAFVLESFC